MKPSRVRFKCWHTFFVIGVGVGTPEQVLAQQVLAHQDRCWHMVLAQPLLDPAVALPQTPPGALPRTPYLARIRLVSHCINTCITSEINTTVSVDVN